MSFSVDRLCADSERCREGKVPRWSEAHGGNHFRRGIQRPPCPRYVLHFLLIPVIGRLRDWARRSAVLEGNASVKAPEGFAGAELER